jgi:thioredoxin-related protein
MNPISSMKLLIIIFFLIFSLPSIEWTTDFNKAKTEATEKSKYILLNFSGSDWCGPCMKLKKEVLDSEAFLKFADDKLVLVRADFPRNKKNKLSPEQTKQNEVLAEKYNNEGKFPLTVLINADGKVVKTWDGYSPSSMSIANLQAEIGKIIHK